LPFLRAQVELSTMSFAPIFQLGKARHFPNGQAFSIHIKRMIPVVVMQIQEEK